MSVRPKQTSEWMPAFAGMTVVRFELGASDSRERRESQRGSEYFTGPRAPSREMV
jgi:hypothetical protein